MQLRHSLPGAIQQIFLPTIFGRGVVELSSEWPNTSVDSACGQKTGQQQASLACQPSK